MNDYALSGAAVGLEEVDAGGWDGEGEGGQGGGCGEAAAHDVEERDLEGGGVADGEGAAVGLPDEAVGLGGDDGVELAEDGAHGPGVVAGAGGVDLLPGVAVENPGAVGVAGVGRDAGGIVDVVGGEGHPEGFGGVEVEGRGEGDGVPAVGGEVEDILVEGRLGEVALVDA